jgi:hypothetical protein
MSALNIFLAVVGLGVTMMVITGMLYLKPHHITQPAVLTDLSDVVNRFVTPDSPAAPVAEPVNDPLAEPPVGLVT